jgi:hypothetical protein
MTYHIVYENVVLDDLDLDDRNRELRHLLQEHDCEVVFTKVDGSLRTMPCTLREAAMPARVVVEEYQTTRLYKPETLSVWCLDKSEWRAFKVANVREIRVLDAKKQ